MKEQTLSLVEFILDEPDYYVGLQSVCLEKGCNADAIQEYCRRMFHESHLEGILWDDVENSIRIAFGYGGLFVGTVIQTTVFVVDSLGHEHEIDSQRMTLSSAGRVS